MIGTGGRSDYVRNLQVGVAQVVILFYALLLIPVIFAGYQVLSGDERNVSGNVARWVVWISAFIPLTAAVIAAVKVFGSRDDRRRAWRLVGWSGGLFVLGIALIAGEAIISYLVS